MQRIGKGHTKPGGIPLRVQRRPDGGSRDCEHESHTQWLSDEIARDARGYLVAGRDLIDQPAVRWDRDREPLTLETSMPGVFAAGDVRHGSIKRVAAAMGEGATVVRLVHEHLREDGCERVSP